MAKVTTVYFCKECGYESAGWLGRCPSCGSWNTLLPSTRATGASAASSGAVSRVGALPERQSWTGGGDAEAAQATDLMELSSEETEAVSSGIDELDRVLGRGFVPGSVVLLGGDPGIGKSTLLLQVSALNRFTGPKLYVSGEESAAQVKLRADRLGIRNRGIRLLTEISFERIAACMEKLKPAFCVVDSIQTLYSEALPSAAGSVSQLREVAAGLLRLAKRLPCCIVLLGHVTKDGALAGPRVLEHMVDTVLYFEGERSGTLRLIRTVKNRFGPSHELAVFEMRADGLHPVRDGSGLFLAERPEHVPGSAVTCSLEGSRPFLMEVQALATPSPYGQAQRTAQGLERSRLQMILAVADHILDAKLAAADVFVNVAGGLKLQDPAADLAVAAAILSSQRRKPIPSSLVLIGELGLTGELRTAGGMPSRVREAMRLGFRSCLVPGGSRKALRTLERELRQEPNAAAEIVYVDRLTEAMDVVFADQEGRH